MDNLDAKKFDLHREAGPAWRAGRDGRACLHAAPAQPKQQRSSLHWHGNESATDLYSARVDKLESLLETHGAALYGVRFDRNEQPLTMRDAAKMSNLNQK